MLYKPIAHIQLITTNKFSCNDDDDEDDDDLFRAGLPLKLSEHAAPCLTTHLATQPRARPSCIASPVRHFNFGAAIFCIAGTMPSVRSIFNGEKRREKHIFYYNM